MTQGQIGYLLQHALGRVDPDAADRDGLDPRARRRRRPGLRVRADQADRPVLRRGRGAPRWPSERGWDVGPDAGRGWRRMVMPARGRVEMLELEQIELLAASGGVVIAAGGGGIPVARSEDGSRPRRGHRQGPLLGRAGACASSADLLVLVTSVARVAFGYGTPLAARHGAADRLRRRSATCATASSRPAAWARRSRRRSRFVGRRRAAPRSPTPRTCSTRSTGDAGTLDRRRRGRAVGSSCAAPVARRELARPRHPQPVRGQRAPDGHRPRRCAAATACRRCEIGMGTPANLEALAGARRRGRGGPGRHRDRRAGRRRRRRGRARRRRARAGLARPRATTPARRRGGRRRARWSPRPGPPATPTSR